MINLSSACLKGLSQGSISRSLALESDSIVRFIALGTAGMNSLVNIVPDMLTAPAFQQGMTAPRAPV